MECAVHRSSVGPAGHDRAGGSGRGRCSCVRDHYQLGSNGPGRQGGTGQVDMVDLAMSAVAVRRGKRRRTATLTRFRLPETTRAVVRAASSDRSRRPPPRRASATEHPCRCYLQNEAGTWWRASSFRIFVVHTGCGSSIVSVTASAGNAGPGTTVRYWRRVETGRHSAGCPGSGI